MLFRRRVQLRKAAAPTAGNVIESARLAPLETLEQFGNLELVTPEVICGWAWNPLAPEESVVVEIFDGDKLLLRLRADIDRQDLREAGIGTGKYGFTVPDPSTILPLARHKISVRRASDGVDLPGSPQWLLRPAAGIDTSLIQFLESAASVIVDCAHRPDELDQHVALALRVLNQLLNARNSLNAERPLLQDPRLQDLLLEADVSDWTRELINKIETEFSPLHFDLARTPLVSVVIPVYNKFRVTYNCLKSLLENLPKASFEVIIVDDCSKDETLFAGFIISGGARIIRNFKNLGFVHSCNAGASHARGKYLFFLNNDTLVRAQWLDELVWTFENVPNVGIAGSKLLFEDGQLQEVGGIIWRLGNGWNWGRQSNPLEPRFCYLRDCDYVSGAALMIERELFQRIGGFDKYYAPAYYEDTDLCFRVRSHGKRVVVQPASAIVHLEGVSAGKDVHGSGMKRFQAINHRKFYERWRDTLSTHRFDGEQPELEAERSVKRRAYFIDDTALTPDQDAGSNAALQHILALMRLGFKVTFLAADNMARIAPYTADLEKLGIECVYAPYYWSVEEVFRKAAVKPDLVYFHRFVNASKYAALVRQHFPNCFTVYNVADLHFLRQQRELSITGCLSAKCAITEAAELAVMEQVDSVIVHSSVEAGLVKQSNPKLRVHTVPWAVRLRPSPTPLRNKSGYAFVGGYRHTPNVDAAVYFVRHILPHLKNSNPNMMGYLVGSNAPPEVVALEQETLKFLGYVPDLTSLLHRLRCSMAPLRYGAGLKGKVLESFAHGLPCVLTEVAAEGMDLPEPLDWLVARSPEEFASKLSAVHDSESLNESLSASALKFVEKNYSEDATQRSLAEAIADKQ